MNFEEALKIMRNDGKVRRKEWKDCCYIVSAEKLIISKANRSIINSTCVFWYKGEHSNFEWSAGTSDLLANDWIEVK